MIDSRKKAIKLDMLKTKNRVLYCLLGIIYLSFIGIQLSKIQAITDFSYRLHEMMLIPTFLALFLIPILSLSYLLLFIKSLHAKTKVFTVKSVMKTILIIISLIIVFWIVGYQFQDKTNTGIYEIKQKVQEDSKYYIILNDKKIRVTRNEYHLIKENEVYYLTYVWNPNDSNGGKLEQIE